MLPETRFIFLSAVLWHMRKASRCVVYSWFDIQEQTAHTSTSDTGKKSPLWVRLRAFPGCCFCARHRHCWACFRCIFYYLQTEVFCWPVQARDAFLASHQCKMSRFVFVLFHFSASVFHVFIEISIRFGVSMICRSFRLCLRFTSEACWERCCITFPFVSFLRHPFLTEL